MPRKKKKKVRSYSDEERRAVVIEYGVTGNMLHTARNLDMNRDTIKNWPQTAWWAEMVEENKLAISDRIEADLNRILELAHGRVVDSLTVGDEKLFYNARLDKIVREKVLPDGKAAATIGGITFDKLRLLKNEPTSIRSDSSNMQKLMQEFRTLSDSYEEKRITSIEGESKEIE